MSALISFAAPSVYASGAPAHNLTTGDFTGNGLNDIAIPDPTNNSVTILLNQGNGTFVRGTPLKLQDPIAVAAGNFTGNGIVDLAVLTDVIPPRARNLAGSSTTDDALVIFDGNGDGTFHVAASYKVIQGGRKIVVGDFNHDGFDDLALSTPHAVGVLLNDNGTFAPEIRYHVSAGSISYMTSGDFNKDGNLDIVVALPAQMGFRELLGNGNGTFTIERTVQLGTPPVWLAVGDFTGDGDEDVAAVNGNFRNGVFIRLGNGDGTFTKAPVVVRAGAFLQSITSADYNGDGIDDLAVVDFTSTVRVLTGNGQATFQPSIGLAGTGPEGFAVYSAVLTPDGKPDLIVLREGDVYVYLNTTEAT
jgi:hypothetical protein